MSKRMILFLTCGILALLIGVGGTFMYIGKTASKEGTLNVNGKSLINVNVKIRRDYAELPFTEVLKGLGYNVEWLDGNTAFITYQDEKYVLNLAEVSLVKDGHNSNIIIPAPGSRGIKCEVLENELVIDSNSLYNIMYTIKKVRISIDRDNFIVSVTEISD